METGYIIGGVACAAYALLCLAIGLLKPAGLMKMVGQKLKLFTGGKEPSEKTVVVTCMLFGVLAAAGAAALFIIGAANAW